MPAKCRQCSAPVDEVSDLCAPCSVELAYRIMNAEPDPTMRHCQVCHAEFRLIEARVLRSVKDPKRGDSHTPFLCWKCAHLHLSAARREPCPNCGRDHAPDLGV